MDLFHDFQNIMNWSQLNLITAFKFTKTDPLEIILLNYKSDNNI
jgi:hypothetical protein